ncbi:MAG TPA: hypothetical protein VG755_32140 [Nannocystaceae bacterium]|nr:hypothetical protein [Nannocystaceae bacterium]
MRILQLVLGSFAIALLASAGPRAVGAPIPKGAICPTPDRDKCLTKGYLATNCGREHAKTCEPFIDAALKTYSARPDAVKTKVLSPKGDDIPKNLHDGNYYPYTGPKRGRGVSVKGVNALSRSGLSLVPKLGITAEQAAEHMRNPAWEKNGKVTSCAEYAYEKLYDWSRFVDATAGCRGDQGCEVDVAFLPGTPGIARRKLHDKLGGEIGNVQFLDNKRAFMKNDFFAFGKRLVYAGGPSGVAQTPELAQLEAALAAGKQYYSLGCKGRCNDRSFSDEWAFHEKMRANTKSLSTEELAEYERRRAELRKLVALHNAAVQKEIGDPTVDVKERAPELPFDLVTNDPFERYDIMKGYDVKARAVAPNVLKQIGPVRLKTMPGAGIETVPVAQPMQGALSPAMAPTAVLAAPLPRGGGPRVPPKPAPTGIGRQAGKIAVSECTKAAFDKAKVEIHEVVGVGPISCRLGKLLREEWARKAAGQKSCLDIDNRDCDWSPQIFKARFANSDRFLSEAQKAQNECLMWTNDSITDKKDIVAVEAYIVEIKKTILAAMIKLAPYRESGGTAGQKFGDQLGDAQFEGDKDWFAGGYDYDLRWSVDPIKKTGPAANDPVCDLRGNFRAAAGVDVWLLKNDISIVDALAQADVNVPNPAKNNERSTHVVSHLTILGKDVYDDVDEYFAMVFEPPIKPTVLFSLPSPKPQWTVMVGPVPITGSAWGELTMGANLRLEGVLKSQTCSADNITFGGIGFFMPWLSIDGRAQVGVGISGLLSAGVRATLNLLTLGIPVDVSLLVNMKKIAGETQAVLAFKAAMDLTLGSLSGSVSLYLEFLMFTEEFELFAWNGVGPATIPLMPPLDAELPIVGMK